MNLPRFVFEVTTPSGTVTRIITSNDFLLASHMACQGLNNITNLQFKGFK